MKQYLISEVLKNTIETLCVGSEGYDDIIGILDNLEMVEVLAEGMLGGINRDTYYDIQIGGKSVLNIFPIALEGKKGTLIFVEDKEE